MDSPLGVLFQDQMRRWFSARGFWVVIAAALVPTLLTGAWVLTHNSDVAVTEVTISPEEPVRGQLVFVNATVENIGDTSVDKFNFTLNLGQVQGRSLQPVAPPGRNTIEDGLEPGETATVRLNWSARPGSYYAVATADPPGANGERELTEVETLNNQKAVPLAVRYPEPDESEAPEAPDNITGNPDANQTADVAVTDVTWTPTEPRRNQTVVLEATYVNQGNVSVETNLTLSVSGSFGSVAAAETSRERTLEPDESTTVTLTWNAREGSRWVEATANVTDEGVHDPDGSNNHEAQSLTVQPVEGGEPPEPPESTTVKAFYRLILDLLYLPLLLPLLGLYYAGGLISDERRDGTLPYLLTRPLERWLLPTTKFLAGFIVSAVAVTIGLVATYLLLFQVSTTGSVAFLYGPLALSLLSLFVYGALFSLLAVLVDHPYLIGLVLVVLWEDLVGSLVPWVQNLTVKFHLSNLLNAWWNAEDLVFRTLPEWGGAKKPLAVLLASGIGFLLLAGLAMRYREFPDA